MIIIAHIQIADMAILSPHTSSFFSSHLLGYQYSLDGQL